MTALDLVVRFITLDHNSLYERSDPLAFAIENIEVDADNAVVNRFDGPDQYIYISPTYPRGRGPWDMTGCMNACGHSIFCAAGRSDAFRTGGVLVA